MPRGGFDPQRSLQGAEQIIQFSEAMKQRRLRRENPLAATLQGMSQAEGLLGQTEVEENPELFSQLMRIQGVEDPAQIEQARTYYKGQRSVAKQKRIKDLQAHIGNELARWQESKAANASRSARLRESGNADLADMEDRQAKFLEQQDFQSILSSVRLGFSDVLQTPEVQELLRGFQTQGIMGPTTPMPAGGQQPALPGQPQRPRRALGAAP
jgi:hypothetical protein